MPLPGRPSRGEALDADMVIVTGQPVSPRIRPHLRRSSSARCKGHHRAAHRRCLVADGRPGQVAAFGLRDVWRPGPRRNRWRSCGWSCCRRRPRV